MEQEYSRWLSHVAESDLLSQLQTMSEQERREAFCCDLSFGTGGLRGIVGAGTNRMNIYTVCRATQGLANYLKAQKLPMSAAIAHDSRLYGRTFAETAACVLAANGIKVYLYPRLEPTPALSWAVRRYACGAGICITASHNPAQYNGYKVYGSDGCQITLDAANAIEAEIAGVDCFMDVQTCGYQEACADGRIESIPDSVLDAYINAVYAQRVTDIDCSGLRLVYTPLWAGMRAEAVGQTWRCGRHSCAEPGKAGREISNLSVSQSGDSRVDGGGTEALQGKAAGTSHRYRPGLRPLRRCCARSNRGVPAYLRKRNGCFAAGFHLQSAPRRQYHAA